MRWANAVHRVTGDVVQSHRCYSDDHAHDVIRGWNAAGFHPDCDFNVTNEPPVMAGEDA